MASRISTLLSSARRGDRGATDALFAALYTELHKLAKKQLARGGGRATLGPTTLLHEAYLDMCRRDSAIFPDRGRFMAYAARVMRGLIIDYARRRQAWKRGGGFQITTLADDDAGIPADGRKLEEIGVVLDDLAEVDPALAQIVDLKFFCGFSFGEIAQMRGVSERTIQRHWDRARIFLHRALRRELA